MISSRNEQFSHRFIERCREERASHNDVVYLILLELIFWNAHSTVGGDIGTIVTFEEGMMNKDGSKYMATQTFWRFIVHIAGIE